MPDGFDGKEAGRGDSLPPIGSQKETGHPMDLVPIQDYSTFDLPYDVDRFGLDRIVENAAGFEARVRALSRFAEERYGTTGRLLATHGGGPDLVPDASFYDRLRGVYRSRAVSDLVFYGSAAVLAFVAVTNLIGVSSAFVAGVGALSLTGMAVGIVMKLLTAFRYAATTAGLPRNGMDVDPVVVAAGHVLRMDKETVDVLDLGKDMEVVRDGRNVVVRRGPATVLSIPEAVVLDDRRKRTLEPAEDVVRAGIPRGGPAIGKEHETGSASFRAHSVD